MADDTPKLHKRLPTIVASCCATVTAAFAARWLNVAGTLIGVAIVSLISGTGAVLYEQGARKAAERAKKLRERGERDYYSTLYKPKEKRDIPWKKILLNSAVILAVVVGTATTVELITHRPVAVTGGGDSPVTAPSHSPTFSPSPPSFSPSSPTFSPTPSTSVPSVVPSTSSPGPSPSSSSSSSSPGPESPSPTQTPKPRSSNP